MTREETSMAALSWKTNAARRSMFTLLLATSLAGFNAAPGRADSVSPACATRDVQILTQMEQHGEQQDIAADRLAIAAFAMQVARAACREGRTEVGLAIYDLIHPQVILVPSPQQRPQAAAGFDAGETATVAR
jgi:hypothetical protein